MPHPVPATPKRNPRSIAIQEQRDARRRKWAKIAREAAAEQREEAIRDVAAKLSRTLGVAG